MQDKSSVFSELMEALKQEFGADSAYRIARLIVQRFPKDRIYIPAKIDIPAETTKETPDTLQKKHKISRATAYRWLGRHRI